MTKVVWLPNETDYSYCEFVVPNPGCQILPILARIHVCGPSRQVVSHGSVLSIRVSLYKDG